MAKHGTLAGELRAAIASCSPALVMTAPGDWRVLQALKTCPSARLPLDVREDRHFFSTVREFAATRRAASRCAWNTSTASMRKRTAC